MYSVCVYIRNNFEYILHNPEFSCFNIWFLTEKHLKFGLRVTLYVYFDLVINIDFKTAQRLLSTSTYTIKGSQIGTYNAAIIKPLMFNHSFKNLTTWKPILKKFSKI